MERQPTGITSDIEFLDAIERRCRHGATMMMAADEVARLWRLEGDEEAASRCDGLMIAYELASWSVRACVDRARARPAPPPPPASGAG
jgi:hypothetical protein